MASLSLRFILVALIGLTACLVRTACAANISRRKVTQKGINGHEAPGANADRYIVSFKPGLSYSTLEEHLDHISTIHHLFSRDLDPDHPQAVGIKQRFNFSTFKAYAGGFDAQTLQEILEAPEVERVELDRPINLYSFKAAPTKSWALSYLTDNNYKRRNPWEFVSDEKRSGQGITVYVLDTGIVEGHLVGKPSYPLNWNIAWICHILVSLTNIVDLVVYQ